MQIPDFINAVFELGGAPIIYLSIRKILKDKKYTCITCPLVIGKECVFSCVSDYKVHNKNKKHLRIL